MLDPVKIWAAIGSNRCLSASNETQFTVTIKAVTESREKVLISVIITVVLDTKSEIFTQPTPASITYVSVTPVEYVFLRTSYVAISAMEIEF